MNFLLLTRNLAIIGALIGLTGIGVRLDEIMRRPFKADLSRAKGPSRRGVLYAFTLGMAPWEKESTRLHWLAYIRGIVFHLGIFAAFAVLFASPWLSQIPGPVGILGALLNAFGGLLGLAGIAMRLTGENERALSLPDDYLSILLTSLWALSAALTLLSGGWLSVFYLLSAVTFSYIPLSKIRHCVYFFYAKFFFGLGFGHRGVLPNPERKYTE